MGQLSLLVLLLLLEVRAAEQGEVVEPQGWTLVSPTAPIWGAANCLWEDHHPPLQEVPMLWLVLTALMVLMALAVVVVLLLLLQLLVMHPHLLTQLLLALLVWKCHQQQHLLPPSKQHKPLPLSGVSPDLPASRGSATAEYVLPPGIWELLLLPPHQPRSPPAAAAAVGCLLTACQLERLAAAIVAVEGGAGRPRLWPSWLWPTC